VPLPSLRRALRVLDPSQRPGGADGDWLLAEEVRLREEVDSFAADFFDLPVAERGRQWESLVSECRDFPPLAGRLRALKAGLEVEPPSLPPDQLGGGAPGPLAELADQLVQSFPLPPVAKAASRQAFHRRTETDTSDSAEASWEQAARYLLAEWPALAALDRELVEEVANLRNRLKQRAESRLRHLPKPANAPAPNGKGSSWGVYAVLVVVFAIARTGMNSNDSSSSRTPAPVYRPPPPPLSPELEDLLRRARAPQPVEGPAQFPTDELPPIRELLNSSEYDVEVIKAGGARMLCFTPRSGSKEGGLRFGPANSGQPIVYGEATLRLRGFSRNEVNALFSQAERKQRYELIPPRGGKDSRRAPRGTPGGTGVGRTRP
jgi:hypothetical protein